MNFFAVSLLFVYPWGYYFCKVNGKEEVRSSLRRQPHGNSIGVRIPRDLAKRAGISVGSTVEIDEADDGIVIKPEKISKGQIFICYIHPHSASSNSQSFYHIASAAAVFVKNEDLTPAVLFNCIWDIR